MHWNSEVNLFTFLSFSAITPTKSWKSQRIAQYDEVCENHCKHLFLVVAWKVKEESKIGQCKRPEKPIEIYEFEGYILSRLCLL
jgi:hypothetical protein